MTYRELIDEEDGLAYMDGRDGINDFIAGKIIYYRGNLYFLSDDSRRNGDRPPFECMEGYRYSWFLTNNVYETVRADIVPRRQKKGD